MKISDYVKTHEWAECPKGDIYVVPSQMDITRYPNENWLQALLRYFDEHPNKFAKIKLRKKEKEDGKADV